MSWFSRKEKHKHDWKAVGGLSTSVPYKHIRYVSLDKIYYEFIVSEECQAADCQARNATTYTWWNSPHSIIEKVWIQHKIKYTEEGKWVLPS